MRSISTVRCAAGIFKLLHAQPAKKSLSFQRPVPCFAAKFKPKV